MAVLLWLLKTSPVSTITENVIPQTSSDNNPKLDVTSSNDAALPVTPAETPVLASQEKAPTKEIHISTEDSPFVYIDSTLGVYPGYPLVTKTLKTGDLDPEVTHLKLFLGSQGLSQHTTVNVDNTFDKNLYDELVKFQELGKLPKTGQTDAATREFINNTAFRSEYSFYKEKLRGTPEWNRYASIPVNLVFTLRQDPNSCNDGKQGAGGQNSCFFSGTITNKGKYPVELSSLKAHFDTTDNIKKLSGVAFWENKILWVTKSMNIDSSRNVKSDLEYPYSINPGQVVDFNVLLDTKLDLIGTVKTSLIGYSTIFKDYSIKNSLNQTVSIIPHTNVGTFIFDVPEFIRDQTIFKNNIISPDTLNNIGTYRVTTNLLDSVEITKFIFKVNSNLNTPYDELFSDLAFIVSASDNPSQINFLKISDQTFSIELKYPLILPPGGGVWTKLQVKPLHKNTQFRIDLIDIESKDKDFASGFPVPGYQTTVQ
jgi:hypothetical protein